MTTRLKKWLETKWMGHFAYVFIQSGYTDPNDLCDCSQDEILALLAKIDRPGHRLKARVLIDDLRQHASSHKSPPPVALLHMAHRGSFSTSINEDPACLNIQSEQTHVSSSEDDATTRTNLNTNEVDSSSEEDPNRTTTDRKALPFDSDSETDKVSETGGTPWPSWAANDVSSGHTAPAPLTRDANDITIDTPPSSAPPSLPNSDPPSDTDLPPDDAPLPRQTHGPTRPLPVIEPAAFQRPPLRGNVVGPVAVGSTIEASRVVNAAASAIAQSRGDSESAAVQLPTLGTRHDSPPLWQASPPESPSASGDQHTALRQQSMDFDVAPAAVRTSRALRRTESREYADAILMGNAKICLTSTGQFTSRFCVLKPTELLWYKHSSALYPTGNLVLLSAAINIRRHEHGEIIAIKSKTMTISLRFETAAETTRWFDQISTISAGRPVNLPPSTPSSAATSTEPSPIQSPANASSAPIEPLGDRVRSVLCKKGVLLKKYTNGQPHTRLFWCSPDLNVLFWGSSITAEPRGTIQISDIIALRLGSASAVRKENSMTIHVHRRTIELEARSITDAVQFMTLLQYLIDNRPQM